ncbi:4-hydroxy-tetrahydrodipicolinate synthase [Paenibacillus tarimensis]
MLNEQQLCGVYVPAVTPFRSTGEVDLESYESYVKTLIGRRIHGIIVGGTTGESPTVTLDELKHLMDITREMPGRRVPMVVGTGTNDTASTVNRSELAGNLGADAVLVVVPYYSRPSQEGIIEHYRKVAEVGVPVIIYDVPSRTGVGMTIQTARTVLEMNNIIGMKDSTGDVRLVSELSRIGSKPVLAGEDASYYAMLCCGAKGGILASANVKTERFIEVYEHYMEGQYVQAKQTFDELIPLIRLLFKESNPAPLKWLLAKLGLISSDTLRLPMTSISDELKHELESILELF